MSSLYEQIVESIRQSILYGEYQAGDELPSVRDLAKQWNCAPNTIMRAYRTLIEQGMIESHQGQGTRVTRTSPTPDPLRLMKLANTAENFILSSLSAGYQLGEIEQALRLVMDRLRVLPTPDTRPAPSTLRFVGSHDPLISALAERTPSAHLHLTFVGSLGGLIALNEGRAEMSGIHLLDSETDSYNLPFVRRILPNQRVALVRVASRQMGLMVALGNPHRLTQVADMARAHVRFINRQSGAGTRVWLDAQLLRLQLSPADIHGYQDEVKTHSEVARLIQDGRADVGVGIHSVATGYGLGFVPLHQEPYDLVIPFAHWQDERVQAVLTQLTGLADLIPSEGYDFSACGQVTWVE